MHFTLVHEYNEELKSTNHPTSTLYLKLSRELSHDTLVSYKINLKNYCVNTNNHIQHISGSYWVNCAHLQIPVLCCPYCTMIVSWVQQAEQPFPYPNACFLYILISKACEYIYILCLYIFIIYICVCVSTRYPAT